MANKFTFTCHVWTPQKVVEPASPGSRARGCPRSPHIPVIEPPSELQFSRGASDEPVEGLAERLETRRVVLQLGGANLGDALDVAFARFSRWAGGPTAAQLSKALRERWAASSPVVGAGVAVPPPAARRRSGGGDAGDEDSGGTRMGEK